MYIFADLVKRGVLTIVGEIRRYRNDCCYHCYLRTFRREHITLLLLLPLEIQKGTHNSVIIVTSGDSEGST